MNSTGLLIWDFDGLLGHRPEGWTGAILEILRKVGLQNEQLEAIEFVNRKRNEP